MSHFETTSLPRRSEPRWVEVGLRDGASASLRPLAHGEAAPLLAVFDQMSSESRALRYLTGLSRLPATMVSMLSDVDGNRHEAWVAFVDDQPAGLARYVRLPGCASIAELAFEVVDHQHGRGLATALVDTVTTVAAARGVRGIRGTLAPSNTASRRLLERLGARVGYVDGLLEAEGPLRLLHPPTVDRSAVLALACAGSFSETLDIG